MDPFSSKSRKRKVSDEKTVSIPFYESTMNEWNKLKDESEFSTHDEFARHLWKCYEEKLLMKVQ